MNKEQLGSSLMPLVKLDYKVDITGICANITMILEYKCFSTNDVKCKCKYPLQKGLVLYKLAVTTKDKILEGMIKPKSGANKAHQRQKENRDQSLTVEERNEKAKLKIGKISKDETVKVVLGLYKLCQAVDECWNLSLPLSIEHGNKKKSAEKVFHSVEVSISTDSQIARVFSKTHKIKVNYYGNKSTAKIQYESESYQMIEGAQPDEMIVQPEGKPSNDENNIKHFEGNINVPQFSMQFRLKDMKRPYILFEKLAGLNEYAYAMCLTPSYCTNSKDTVKDEDVVYADDTIQGSGDFIFLLDNSGSMSGDKISMAKNSLIFLIKGLPPNSIYNIIVFNSSFEKYNEKSCEYTPANVKSTLERIENIGTGGGTNLLTPLQAVYGENTYEGYPRIIIILTDGEVDNRDAVLHEIKSHSNQATVYMLGIGGDVDEQLIIQGANAGKGHYKIVKEANEINAAVIGLLSYGVHPAYTDIQPHWNEAPLLSWTSLKSTPTTYVGQSIYATAIFNGPLNNASIEYVDTKTQATVNAGINIAKASQVNCPGLFKIIADHCINSGEPTPIKGVGIKYKILCSETSLIPKVKSIPQKIVEEIKVPEIQKQPEMKKENIINEIYSNNANVINGNNPPNKLEEENNLVVDINDIQFGENNNENNINNDQSNSDTGVISEDSSGESEILDDEKNLNQVKNENVLPNDQIKLKFIRTYKPEIIVDHISDPKQEEENKAIDIKPRKFQFNRGELTEITEYQELNGNWEIRNVEIFLGMTQIIIIKNIPQKLKSTPNNATVWCTILMIELLKSYYIELKNECLLTINKAINFLKTFNVQCENYIGKANKLLKILITQPEQLPSYQDIPDDVSLQSENIQTSFIIERRIVNNETIQILPSVNDIKYLHTKEIQAALIPSLPNNGMIQLQKHPGDNLDTSDERSEDNEVVKPYLSDKAQYGIFNVEPIQIMQEPIQILQKDCGIDRKSQYDQMVQTSHIPLMVNNIMNDDKIKIEITISKDEVINRQIKSKSCKCVIV